MVLSVITNIINNNYMKTINVCRSVVIFSVFLLLMGCMKEDESDCGILLRFEFTLNPQHLDKFTSNDVNKLTIFVFDKDGNLVTQFEETGTFGADYRKSLRLPAGEYSFVVWGNLADNTDVSTTGNITQRTMLLKAGSNDEVTTPTQHILYGRRTVVINTYGNNQEYLIELMDDTKNVKVIFEGIPADSHDIGNFVCYITAADGDYTFYNSFSNFPRTLTYRPVRTENGTTLINDFSTLLISAYNELTKSSDCNSRLILEYHNVLTDGTVEVIRLMDESLSYLILSKYPDINWVIDNNFVLTFNIDYTNGNFSVTPNGWTLKETEIIIG